jgi:endo-1,4-beta-xylanase
MLYSTLLAATMLPAALGASVSNLVPRQAARSIDAVFKSAGKKYVGVATDHDKLNSGGAPIAKANFGQVTPEWSMKWDQVERTSRT